MKRLRSCLTSQRFWRWEMLLSTIMIVVACFSPQVSNPALPTPGVFYQGRMAFLLIPFNSLWNLGQATSLLHAVKIVFQNVLKLFLLYPLVFGLLMVRPSLRSVQSVIMLGFTLSLSIELTQLALDCLWDFNRVFELDDLLTNTFGAYLAYRTYLFLEKRKVVSEEP